MLAQNATDTSDISLAYDQIVDVDSGDDSLKLLYVGTLDSRKMLSNLVDACARVIDRFPVTVRIVGDGPARQSLVERIADLGMSQHVALERGTREPEILAGHLRWADVGVLPNQGGLFLNTAMSCGVPVICGLADGTEEDLVIEGVTGWRVADGSAVTITAALVRVFNERSQISEIGARARAHYESTATMAHMIRGIDDALRAVVSGDAGRR
jgi:glycosyltransferase involved in cell wall biosynthesis